MRKSMFAVAILLVGIAAAYAATFDWHSWYMDQLPRVEQAQGKIDNLQVKKEECENEKYGSSEFRASCAAGYDLAIALRNAEKAATQLATSAFLLDGRNRDSIVSHEKRGSAIIDTEELAPLRAQADAIEEKIRAKFSRSSKITRQ